ncbi:hypothetical protein F4778DRAFT_6328 [Xylariomycetidae sp. FL2044]|nr:hypothetical protein F4778DRAFT_6328 [Xylariomycetidae sp. FL2044]
MVDLIPRHSTMANILPSIPAYMLAFEYFLGAIPRISAFPFLALHQRVYLKSKRTAPHLHPVFPFKDNVSWQMRYTGLLMAATGCLIASPRTRGSLFTLSMECFLNGAGFWSQWKAGLPYWLPLVNFGLGWVVWGLT